MNRLTKKYSYGYLPQYERETKENYYDLVYTKYTQKQGI